MKLCKNCIYYQEAGISAAECHHGDNVKIVLDPVNGRHKYFTEKTIWVCRSSLGHCGKEAIHFDPKPQRLKLFQWLRNLFK